MWTSKLGEGSYTLIVDSKDEILFNSVDGVVSLYLPRWSLFALLV